MPTVSIIMPVYNGERYLSAAIVSVLTQTYQDYEFIIVDDGSTDCTWGILKDYSRQFSRIRIFRNGENRGIPAALNRALHLATGKYVARMDCDDICHPSRLEKQVAFLDANPDCAVVASFVGLISDGGHERGFWGDDISTVTRESIRRFLPRANCIADPSVMMRKEVLRKYKYNRGNFGTCDYDLWLRMAADGVVIGKIPGVLLRYRIHSGSVTAKTTGNRPEIKNARVKAKFLARRLVALEFNRFDVCVLRYLVRDICYALGREVFGVCFRLRGVNNATNQSI